MDEVRQDHAGQEGKVNINHEEYKKVLKKYKKLKRYMRSNLFAVKTMAGDEDVISKLIDEANLDEV